MTKILVERAVVWNQVGISAQNELNEKTVNADFVAISKKKQKQTKQWFQSSVLLKWVKLFLSS